MQKRTYLALFGVILAVGLMASAFILGQQFKNFRQTGTITVKGLAEAEHNATIGSWQVTIGGWGESYAEAMESNKAQLDRTIAFLSHQGFGENAREITDLSVSPYMEEYEDEKGNLREKQNGYQAKRYVIISTKDLAKLQQTVTAIQRLAAEDQDIDFSAPQYYLENLEQIKRELIAKATQDAYVRAEEFAKTSGTKVGSLKSASQGAFNILSTRPTTDDAYEYGGSYDTSTIGKKVRLVVTIEYAID